MSKGNTTENDLLLKFFNDMELSWDSISNIYASLHTADPGEGGDQTSNECDYTGYARVAVSRDSGGWTVSGNQSSNTAEITFGECTSGTNVISHVGVGIASTGTGQVLYSGALNSSLSVSNGITPRFIASALQIQED